MWIAALCWLACSAEEAPPVRSKPVSPTADLEPPPAPEPQWTTLEGFLPPQVGIPLPLRPLHVGMNEAEAVAVLEKVKTPHSDVVPKGVEGRQVHTVTIDGFATASVALVMDERRERVASIQITMPAGEGETALMRSWGEAQGVVLPDEEGNGGGYVWSDDRQDYTWKTPADGQWGLLVIDAHEAPPAPKP